MRFAIVASTVSPTNRRLLEAARALGLETILLAPHAAQRRLRAGDVALGRIDVLPTLDGPEPGLSVLQALEERDVLVLNRAGPLFTTHDKLATALRLATHRIPHPRTTHIGPDGHTGFSFPLVVKPRFGSWGREVTLCRDAYAFERCLDRIRHASWFPRQGAIVQELVPPRGYDLRVVVAAGRVVGAVTRVAAPGEWRTNVALGGTRRAAVPSREAVRLAVDTASAFGIDLCGIDLLPDGRGGWVVIELNGAVDLTTEYGLTTGNVFAEIIGSLALAMTERRSLRAGRFSRPA